MPNVSREYARLTVGFSLAAVTLLILLATTNSGGAKSTVMAVGPHIIDPTSASTITSNCRYGVAALPWIHTPWVSSFGAGWYMTFAAYPPSQPTGNDAEFAHVIRTQQDQDGSGGYLPTYQVNPPLTDSGGLGTLLAAYPGALWMVGNEVDRGPDPGQLIGGQDHTFPDIYATAYHEVYEFIKQRDPTARVAISGLVEVTPGRLEYLDKVWDAYQTQYGTNIPVDVWNMHLYILPELDNQGNPNGIANIALGTDIGLGRREAGGNPALCPLDEVYCFAEHDDMSVFAEQVVAMRSWMKAHGQQNKPLILSEYSLLYPYEDDGATCFLQDEYGGCFTPSRVSAFASASFDYLDNLGKDPALGYPLDNDRLVQQWMWFALLWNGAGSASNLLVETPAVTTTAVGQTIQNHVLSAPLSRNLVIESVSNPVTVTNGLPNVDVPLKAIFRNNGNTSVTSPVTVTFFSDSGMTTVIDSVAVSPTVRGCATKQYTAQVIWTARTPGIHHFWVRIDSAGNVNGSDNIDSGVVLVDPRQILLPILLRQ